MYKKKWVVEKLISVFKKKSFIIVLCNYIGGNLVVDKSKLISLYGQDSFFIKGSLISKFLVEYYNGVLLSKKLKGNLFFIFVEQAKYVEVENNLRGDLNLVPLYVFKNDYCFSFYDNWKNYFLMDSNGTKGSFIKLGFNKGLLFNNLSIKLACLGMILENKRVNNKN